MEDRKTDGKVVHTNTVDGVDAEKKENICYVFFPNQFRSSFGYVIYRFCINTVLLVKVCLAGFKQDEFSSGPYG